MPADDPKNKVGFNSPGDPPEPKPAAWPKPILRLVQAAKKACTPQPPAQPAGTEPPPSDVQVTSGPLTSDVQADVTTPEPPPSDVQAPPPTPPATRRDSLTQCPDGTWLYRSHPSPIGIECRLEAEDQAHARFLVAEALASLRLICEGSRLLRLSLLVDPSCITRTPDGTDEEEMT